MKLKIITLLLPVMLITACITTRSITYTSGLTTDEIANIPKGASEVIVTKQGASPEDLYQDVYNALIKRGHRIMKSDNDNFYITTEGKDVGQSTMQRMTIVVTSDTISKAIIKCEWKAGTYAATTASMFAGMPVTNEWERVVFDVNRLGIAFAECVAVAKEISGAIISYN